MDWQQLIDGFLPLSSNEVMLFAPPREMEQAISTFNRAIFNLNHDSADIALIALRKLVTTYPMFARATLLLGCCQAQLGQYDEALEQFAHAQLAGLPDEWQEQEICHPVVSGLLVSRDPNGDFRLGDIQAQAAMHLVPPPEDDREVGVGLPANYGMVYSVHARGDEDLIQNPLPTEG